MTPPFEGVAYMRPWGVWYTRGEIMGAADAEDFAVLVGGALLDAVGASEVVCCDCVEGVAGGLDFT